MIGAVLSIFLQILPMFEGQLIVDGVDRSSLCPSDACWVPVFYDNREEEVGGECVTQLSYEERCDDGDCYFCVTEPLPTDGYSDGTNCSYSGTAIGAPPQGMVYPGVSGSWSGTELKLHQLLCEGDFHPCKCGDTACLLSFSTTQERCVNIAVPFASQESNDNNSTGEAYCCTATRSYISLISGLQVTLFVLVSTCATFVLLVLS
uniref:Uncharacterized protein n=1 Tax=Proboscia inermis TaxID=420281 RepID=A0A7S0CGH3_9STRA|mmetsp:Transcript_46859/g.47329  ORF Transcript_46859/g.47329 Transcript_46859/m.47329 type:complete len:205 (+) Transcript_46859:113-727(+)